MLELIKKPPLCKTIEKRIHHTPHTTSRKKTIRPTSKVLIVIVENYSSVTSNTDLLTSGAHITRSTRAIVWRCQAETSGSVPTRVCPTVVQIQLAQSAAIVGGTLAGKRVQSVDTRGAILTGWAGTGVDIRLTQHPGISGRTCTSGCRACSTVGTSENSASIHEKKSFISASSRLVRKRQVLWSRSEKDESSKEGTLIFLDLDLLPPLKPISHKVQCYICPRRLTHSMSTETCKTCSVPKIKDSFMHLVALTYLAMLHEAVSHWLPKKPLAHVHEPSALHVPPLWHGYVTQRSTWHVVP